MKRLLITLPLLAALYTQPGCETAQQKEENAAVGRYDRDEAIKLAATAAGEAIVARLPEAVGGGPVGWILAAVTAASAGAAAYAAARRPGAKGGTQTPPAQ